MKIILGIFSCLLLTGILSSCKSTITTPTVNSIVWDSTGQFDTLPRNRFPRYVSHKFEWKQFALPSGQTVSGVWVFAPDNILAIGNTIYRFDGIQWKPIVGAENILTHNASIFALDSDHYWLIGDLIYQYAFTIFTEYSQYGYHAAWGTSAQDMFFVGDAGAIIHFDGQTWAPFPSQTPVTLRFIQGRNDNDIWASGYDYNTGKYALLHYNGSSWRLWNLSGIGITQANAFVTSEWSGDSLGHPVNVLAGSSWWTQIDGGRWEERGDAVSVGKFPITYISGNNANDLIATGSPDRNGYFAHWNGLNWQGYPGVMPLSQQDYFTGLSFNGNTVCISANVNQSGWLEVGQRR